MWRYMRATFFVDQIRRMNTSSSTGGLVSLINELDCNSLQAWVQFHSSAINCYEKRKGSARMLCLPDPC